MSAVGGLGPLNKLVATGRLRQDRSVAGSCLQAAMEAPDEKRALWNGCRIRLKTMSSTAATRAHQRVLQGGGDGAEWLEWDLASRPVWPVSLLPTFLAIMSEWRIL